MRRIRSGRKVGKRGAWLIQSTLQVPRSGVDVLTAERYRAPLLTPVRQEPSMAPYSVVNTALVPSATGLLNLSATRTVRTT